jgi:hypothetical protein
VLAGHGLRWPLSGALRTVCGLPRITPAERLSYGYCTKSFVAQLIQRIEVLRVAAAARYCAPATGPPKGKETGGVS